MAAALPAELEDVAEDRRGDVPATGADVLEEADDEGVGVTGSADAQPPGEQLLHWQQEGALL